MAETKTSRDFSSIRRGIRVRHTADGVEGKITWANGVLVKIEWDDGEKVTWKRAELASKGLEILYTEPDQEEMEAEAQALHAPSAVPAAEPTAPEPRSAPEPFGPLNLGVPGAGGIPEAPPAADLVAPAVEPAAETHDATATDRAPEPKAEPEAAEPAPPAMKRTKRTGAKRKAAKTEQLSAIDAAARVLQEAGKAMNCQEMIGLMAAKGYWTSPGGKTPAATLYSAILREMQTKGDDARFVKAAKGQFAIRARS